MKSGVLIKLAMCGDMKQRPGASGCAAFILVQRTPPQAISIEKTPQEHHHQATAAAITTRKHTQKKNDMIISVNSSSSSNVVHRTRNIQHIIEREQKGQGCHLPTKVCVHKSCVRIVAMAYLAASHQSTVVPKRHVLHLINIFHPASVIATVVLEVGVV